MVRQASRRKFHFIYQTTCKVTGRYYRGMHSTDDMDDEYLGSGKQLWNSLRKHGRNNHERLIIEDCSDQGRAFLREREKFWVGQEQLNDPLCMNLVPGGRDCGKLLLHTDEFRHQMSETLKNSEAHKAFILLMKGKKKTDDHKQKLSKAAKKQWIDGRGMHHTNESKKKIGDANRMKRSGTTASDETRQRMSQAQLRRFQKQGGHSESTKQKMIESKKNVSPETRALLSQKAFLREQRKRERKLSQSDILSVQRKDT